MTFTKVWLYRITFLAALLLASGAGEKWRDL
jgi:hypothetical protein